MKTNIFNNIEPSKKNYFNLGSKKNKWNTVFTKNLFSNNATIKNLKVDKLTFNKDYLCQSFGIRGQPGPQGLPGKQGPALFTLYDASNNVENMTSNSIETLNETNTYIVNTIERYYTAFLTIKLNIGENTTFGFLSNANINTFAFAFQMSATTYSIVYNCGGAIGTYGYEPGDIFTICLTSVNCKFFQNGNLILNVGTDTLYLNVIAKFYIVGTSNISNISYGYLNDIIMG